MEKMAKENKAKEYLAKVNMKGKIWKREIMDKKEPKKRQRNS